MLNAVKEYIENNQKAYNEGRITAEAYDESIENLCAFLEILYVDNDEQEMLRLEQQGGII